MIRPFRHDDAEAVLALTRSVLPLRVETVASVLWEAARARVLVAEAPAGIVGVARVRGRKLALGVAPQARRQGIGTALWDAAETIAGGVETCWVVDGNGIEFVRARGFVPTRRVLCSALDLRTATEPTVTPPPGVQLVRWSELGAPPAELEADEHTAAPHLRPDGSFAALDDGRPVAYALLAADERGVGESQYTFTLPSHRGRGFATLCKHAVIAWAAEHGLRLLVAANDAENTAMLEVNRRLGYRERQVQTTLVRAGAK